MFKKLLLLLPLIFSIHSFAQEFTSIWNTANIDSGSSTDTQISIPTNPLYTYNYVVDWGDGSSDANVAGDITHTYDTAGIYTVKISGAFPAIFFNSIGDTSKITEILSWGAIEWETMEAAFAGCNNLNFDAIDAPDLSRVTSLKNMFLNCTSFNGIVNNWNITRVTDISGLFMGASIFNRPLDNWNTIAVTNMTNTFNDANLFNEPLDNWITNSVTNLDFTFRRARDFNQNINSWNVDNVTSMESTFETASDFNKPLNNWNVNNVTNMANMFFSSNFNQPIENWNVAKVTNMSGMFFSSDFNQPINGWVVDDVTDMSRMFGQSEFNQPLDSWIVTNVTNMYQMFYRHRTFNQPLNNWDVSNVTNMESMFDGWIWGGIYNLPLNNWNVANVTNMRYMFRDNSAFNQNINTWEVGAVTNMEGMFENAPSFNQPLNDWDVGNVTTMESMFQETDSFNQPLNNWNVANVLNMSAMFYQSLAFDSAIDLWQVTKVTDFYRMFSNTIFNQNISGWNTLAAVDMEEMFNNATLFDQNLGAWNIVSVTDMTNMLSGTAISQENYDNLLIGWATQSITNAISLGANNLTYCDGRDARQRLIDDYNWTFNGDSVNCTFVLCTQITSPVDGDANVPANSDIRWNPAPNATGYTVSISIENTSGTQIIYDNQDFGNVVGLDFTNEFTPGDLVYVTVIPYNDEGPATGCEEISFTVIESWVNNPAAFKLTYDTTIQIGNTTTAINQLRVEPLAGLTYDYSIDWGDGQYNNNVTNEIIHTYLVPGVYTISIIGTFPAPYHTTSNNDAYKLLSIDQWGTQQWLSMQNAFYNCVNMEYNATDIPDLSLATSMGAMFRNCSNFNGAINDWDVSTITNMSSLFYNASIYNQPLNNWAVTNVSSMYNMFYNAIAFNQNINSWDTGAVTSMYNMFRNAEAFNEPINDWNVALVTTMDSMFRDTAAFDQPLNNWEVFEVTDMSEMFRDAAAFNKDIDSWQVSKVIDMTGMFYNATAFDMPLNSWDVSNVINMVSMFYNASSFNKPLDNWTPNAANSFAYMFSRASAFNQNINNWNVTNITSMQAMFNDADMFNQPLNNWDVNSVINTVSMFQSADAFNQPLNNWDVSAVANMSYMFEDTPVFDQPLNNWDVSSVTLMTAMFEDALVFNQNLNDWDVSVVTSMDSMFKNAQTFNTPLDNWVTNELQTTAAMFNDALTFNQNINTWNVSFVTTMEEMFYNAVAYNQPMDSWVVASVTNMERMFRGATAFNEAISSWNVRAVESFEEMFYDATAFNQHINNWRANNATNMDDMFRAAIHYNQPMDLWFIGAVSMENMFRDATAFNQSLADWNVSNVTEMRDMLDNTALSRINYDNTLIAWSALSLTPNITLGAQGLLYCASIEERQAMITTYGWTFSGDILDCPVPECTLLTSPENGAIDVPINTNLVWEEILYALEYDLTITLQPSGTIINETVTTNAYEFATDVLVGATSVTVLIEPKNGTGIATACTLESFSLSTEVAAVPECTVLANPIANAVEVALDTNLSWEAISNADGYFITVATTPGGNDILNNEDVGNVISYDLVSDLPENVQIYVTIIPYNEEGNATGCSEESFTTELLPVAPSCVTLSSPINGATDVLITTDLTWNSAALATGYLVSVGTTSGGIEIANGIDVGNITTYSFPTDLPETRTLYVTIIPYNAVGDAIGCTEESFTTETLPTIPVCTTLTSPANAAVDVLLGTDLTWNAISDATGYLLTVGTSTGATDIINNQDVGNVTTFDIPTDLPETTTIFVTITPYNAVGNAISCFEESFTTETLPIAPICTNLTNPLNAAVAVLITTDITWNAVTDATGYLLTIGTSTGATDIINNQDVGNITTFDIPTDLPEGTEVFVSVIPYNAVGNATGCTEESFTTQIIPRAPICTNLTNPLNAALDVLLTTDITWNAVTDATGYLLTIGTSTGATDIINNQDVGNVTTFDVPTDLPEGTAIFVSVTPYNAVGNATGCTEESFTTQIIPRAPICTNLTNPLNAALDVLLTTDITWNAVTDATGYLLTIGTSTGATDIINNQDVGNITTFDIPTDLPEGTAIFVSVTPYNAVGNATGCTEESFTTQIIPRAPICTNLTNPLNTAVDVLITTDITWNALTDATGYLLTIGTSTGATDIINNQDVGNVTTFDIPTDLPEGTEVFVSVTPYNAVGNATGCTEESFTTQIIPRVPICTTLTNPLNAALDVLITTDITWNAVSDATGYLLTIGTSTGATDIINNQDVGNITTFDIPTDLPEGTAIFVSVTPYNAVGNATGCTEESFTTQIIPRVPICTTLTNPLNAATDVAVDLAFVSWSSVADADGYKITITGTATNDITDVDVNTDTTYDFTDVFVNSETVTITITPYNSFGDATGCSASTFTIIDRPKNEVLFGFSPNNDGINDFWEIEGIEAHPSNVVTIYNRWGDIVFKMNDYDNQSNVFRGIANTKTGLGGGKLPDGTYFFQFTIEGEHNFKKLNGYVVIKR